MIEISGAATLLFLFTFTVAHFTHSSAWKMNSSPSADSRGNAAWLKSNAGTDVWLSPCGSCTFTHVCFLLSIWGLYKADILPTIFTVNTHTPIPLWLVFISWNANWSIRDYSHLPALKGQPSLSLSLHYHHLFSFVILLIVWDFFSLQMLSDFQFQVRVDSCTQARGGDVLLLLRHIQPSRYLISGEASEPFCSPNE